jgi:hypothetical protein
MQNAAFETMQRAALAAAQRQQSEHLRAIFDQFKVCSGLSSAEGFMDALDAAGAPCVPVNLAQAAQYFAQFSSSNQDYVTFEEFKRAVAQPDSLEKWLNEEASFKLGAFAPALRAAIQMQQVSVPLHSCPDPALAPLLAFGDMDEETVSMAIDASLEAIKKQLISRQSSLRLLIQSKARAEAKRDEFVSGQMEVGTIQNFYDGLQGRVGWLPFTVILFVFTVMF